MARAGVGSGLGCLFSLGMFRMYLGNLGDCFRFCAVGHTFASVFYGLAFPVH